MSSLKELHDNYINKLKKSGVALTEFECPKCSTIIETRIPDSGIYDSMTQCPECEEMFFKIVHANGKVEIK